jgi:outer membrane protein OmpA-like peptidoglycan-associated protein
MRGIGLLAGTLALTATCAVIEPARAQNMSVDEIRANIDAQIRAKEKSGPAASPSATRSLKINNHQDTEEPLYDRPAPAGGGAPAPSAQPVAAAPAVAPLLFNIEFDYNSDRPRPDAQPILLNIAAALSDPRFAGRVFLIIGHTDSKGSADYNRALSQRRADAVVAALVKLTVPRDRITPLGRGEDEPRKIDGREATDAENRRVEIRLL